MKSLLRLLMEASASSSSSSSNQSNPLDFTLRVIESTAFSLHALLGVTEPFTGCLKRAFGDDNNMVWWGWPVAGILLATVAFCNFAFADNTAAIVFLQWYIVTFHFGAIWYHIRLGHNPVVGIAPGMFIPIALALIGVRLGPSVGWYLVVLLPFGAAICAAMAFGLCRLLVKAPGYSSSSSAQRLMESEDSLLNR